MDIKLFNTLGRELQDFKPVKKGSIGLYSCGPTVYWFAHIGNMRAYIFADTLRRMFEYNGFGVEHVMNITDVGHLTSNEDEGEDKMLLAMRREGKTAYEIAEFYTEAFQQDLVQLNIQDPNTWCKATDYIDEQIDLVKKLEENGFTYITGDGVYFDTSKLKDYGKLSGQRLEDKEGGKRVALGDKKNPTDFALWKFSPKDHDREMEWDSPWGTGFPGWHLECSAMSVKHFGIPFDVHTGGIDHIAVHHENEIAQSAGAFGKLQANYWVHNEFITVDSKKMSKSIGNLYLIKDIIEQGFEPLAYRYLTYSAHHRTKLNFTWEALEGSQNALRRLYDTVRDWDSPTKISKSYHKEFLDHINNDLDMPGTLAIVWKLVDDKDLETSVKAATLLDFDKVLALKLDQYIAKPVEVPPEVQKLVDEREQARKDKDWTRSDELRDEIRKLGYKVKDTADGPKILNKR